mmetsp:Transcript_10335/g.22877  ORF Transcript_10335/g.22877 Transcript_10335/m.22877 type:complete len:800 (+) Transcript_10335:39-2438(+)
MATPHVAHGEAPQEIEGFRRRSGGRRISGRLQGSSQLPDAPQLVFSCFQNLRADIEVALKKRQDALTEIFDVHSSAPTASLLAAGDLIRGTVPHTSTNTDSFGGSDMSSDLHFPRTLAGSSVRPSKQGSLSPSDIVSRSRNTSEQGHLRDGGENFLPEIGFLHRDSAFTNGSQNNVAFELAAKAHLPGAHLTTSDLLQSVTCPEGMSSPGLPGGAPPPIKLPLQLRAAAKAKEAWAHAGTEGNLGDKRFDRGSSWQTSGSGIELSNQPSGSRPLRPNAFGDGPNAKAHRRLSRMGSMASLIASQTPKRAVSAAKALAFADPWASNEKITFKDPTASIGPRALLMHEAEAGHSSWRLNELASVKDDGREPGGGINIRRRIKRGLSHWLFDALVGVIIAMNAVTVGLETQNAAQGKQSPAWVEVCEHIFLAVYAGELLLRLFVYRTAALRSGWIQFDALLVSCGLIEVVVQDLILSGEDNLELDKFIWLRILRLARLARSLRLFVQFHVLWLLVEGLIHSFNTICSTFLVISVLLYIFSVVSLEVIVPDSSDEAYSTAQKKFETLFDAMLTLLQFTTLDAASAVYTPLITSKPAIAIYVIIFLLTVSIAAMNLVTAQVVESALQMAKKNRDGRAVMHKRWKQTLIPKLSKLFEELDTDGSGELELDELLNAPDDVQEQLLEIVGLDEILELFQALDTDGSGTVGIDEFCETVVNTAEKKPLEMIHIMKLCRHMVSELGDVRGSLARLDARLMRIEVASGTGQKTPRGAVRVPEAAQGSEMKFDDDGSRCGHTLSRKEEEDM